MQFPPAECWDLHKEVGKVTNDLAWGMEPHARRRPSASGLLSEDLLST